MKKTGLYIIFIATLIGCKKEKEVTKVSDLSYVTGSVSYFDDLTGETITDFTGVKTTIAATQDTEYESWIKHEDTNSNYIMGPYNVGCYTLHSQYTNAESGITYTYDKNKVEIIDTSKTLTLDFKLEANYNYTLLCNIEDSVGGAVPNANVYLYTNYTHLENYRGNENAAIAKKVTNNKGKVLFTDLEEMKYYIYAEKIIILNDSVSDTLHTYLPAFNPNTTNTITYGNLDTKIKVLN